MIINQDITELATGLLTLLKTQGPSKKNMEVEGTALICDFVRRPGVENTLMTLDLGQKVRLWGKTGSGLQILLHGTDTPKKTSPHDHGNSWALYFQLAGITEMSTYTRRRGVPGTSGSAVLKLENETIITPGRAMFFGPLEIHSTHHPSPPARWIRVTGTDLDFVKRLRFSIERREAVVEKKINK